MTLKQRRTPFDHFLLQVVFPMVAGTPLRPAMRLARMWHTSPQVSALPVQQPVELRRVATSVELAQAA
ncbi:MAG TPA: hypothetical protein VFS62_13730 [Chloroflexota bacterium]|nr:hypothetical protein [Chloroflexota bacterium]